MEKQFGANGRRSYVRTEVDMAQDFGARFLCYATIKLFCTYSFAPIAITTKIDANRAGEPPK